MLRWNRHAEFFVVAVSIMTLSCEKRRHEPSARPQAQWRAQNASASDEGGGARANEAEKMVKTNVVGRSGYLVVPSPVSPKVWMWRPDERTIEEFEKGLTESGVIDVKIVEQLGRFVRQYSGMLVDGERVLQVDFYCELPKGIEQHPVFVTDWVGCQASVEYLPNRRLYRNFIGTIIAK